MSEDQSNIKKKIESVHYIKQFATQGKELLERTETTNIITLAQFEPYRELFAIDKTRFNKDAAYMNHLTQLFNAYRVNLEINLFHPTIVVDRLEEPRRELYFLDRMWTRIRPDFTEGTSAKDKVPSNVSKAAEIQRSDMLQNASLQDLMNANADDKQIKMFQLQRMESALILSRFVERNLRPESRATFLKDETGTDTPSPNAPVPSQTQFVLDDDDD